MKARMPVKKWLILCAAANDCHGLMQAETLAGQRIVVVVDSWEADSLHPAGHFVRKLGAIGDKDTETEVLLIENDINTSPFTPGVHACVPPLPWSIQESDWLGR